MHECGHTLVLNNISWCSRHHFSHFIISIMNYIISVIMNSISSSLLCISIATWDILGSEFTVLFGNNQYPQYLYTAHFTKSHSDSPIGSRKMIGASSCLVPGILFGLGSAMKGDRLLFTLLPQARLVMMLKFCSSLEAAKVWMWDNRFKVNS